MFARCLMIACLASMVLSVGCGPAGDDSKDGAAPAKGAAHRTIRHADPSQATSEYLTALLAGDLDRAMAMMTDKALAASEKSGVKMEPPGSKRATFRIAEQMIMEDDPNAAQVWSVISDTTEQGQSESYDIVWLLKRDEQGWAISGMATVLFEHEFVIDFEDAADVAAKRQWAAAQAQKAQLAQQAQQTQPAQQPSGTPAQTPGVAAQPTGAVLR